jgi:hypothetical protein
MFVKGTTFFMGFGFFGQPILERGLNWLNHTYPNWQKLLEIRKYSPPPNPLTLVPSFAAFPQMRN